MLLILSFLALAGGAILYAGYRQDLASARERLQAARTVVDTPCGPMEYAVRGDGPPILVVHGAGGGFDQGLIIGADLLSAGYRTIAVSRFGYLGAPLPGDASPEAQADAFACLLDALELDRVAVLGASAGAPSSLQLALRHAERVSALILLVPATYLPGSGGRGATPPAGLELIFDTALRMDFLFWLASRVLRSWFIRTMLGTPPELLIDASAEERAMVSSTLDAVLPVSERRPGLLNDAKVTTDLPRYALERIRAPTLIISAEDDGYGTYERARYTAGEIPGARFVGYSTGGHLLVGRQAAVAAEMLELLRGGPG